MREVVNIKAYDGMCVFVPGDIHAGVEDKPVLRLYQELCLKEEVTDLVLIGDTHNCGGVNPHKTDSAKFMTTLDEEDESVAPWIQEMVNEFSVTALCGNHEMWIYAFLAKNPGISRNRQWHDFFPLSYKNVTCLKPYDLLKIGPLLYDHGHNLRGSIGVSPARRVLHNYPGQNTVFGHCHQQDQDTTPTSKDGRQVLHGAYAVGHSSIPHKHLDYAASSGDRWAQGGAKITYYEVDNRLIYNVSMVTVFRDRRNRPYIAHNGRVYK